MPGIELSDSKKNVLLPLKI